MKRCPATLSLGLALLVASFATTAEGSEAAGAYPSPNEIQPLLLGTEVPDVLVRQLDGSEASLKELVAAAPTVLIFYRGGW